MWNSKGCPRCRGDIFIDEEVGTKFIKCLQCGWEKEIMKPSPVRLAIPSRKRAKAGSL